MLAVAVTIVFTAAVWVIYPIQFETNDDYTLMLIASGATFGSPSAVSVYSAYAQGLLLSRLYTAFPSLPWYGFYQLFLIWFSLCVIIYCFLDTAYREKIYFLYTAVFIGGFLLLFAMQSVFLLQFTVTLAFPSGAAFLLFFRYAPSYSAQIRTFVVYALSIFILSLAAYSMRHGTAVIPGLIITLAIALWKLVFEKNIPRRHIALLAVCPFVAIALLTAQTTYANNSGGWAKFLEYNKQRSLYIDYNRQDYVAAPEVFDAVGWTPEQVDLINEWCFMFDGINANTFALINAGLEQAGKRVKPFDFIIRIPPAFERNKTTLRVLGLTILSVVAFAVYRLRCKKIKIHLQRDNEFFAKSVFLAGLSLLFCAFALYLLIIGRFPARAMRMLLLMTSPCIVYALFTMCHKIFDARQKWAICAVLAGILLITAFSQRPQHYQTLKESRLIDNMAVYVTNRPHNIYIYGSDELALSTADPLTVYPDMGNLLFWGGWKMFTPLFYRQIERLGLSELTFDVFLRDNVYFLSYNPLPAFVDYLREQYPKHELSITDSFYDNAGNTVNVYKLKNRSPCVNN